MVRSKLQTILERTAFTPINEHAKIYNNPHFHRREIQRSLDRRMGLHQLQIGHSLKTSAKEGANFVST